jgi:hypothetical protein
VYRQILINAKVKLGKRGQETEMTGRRKEEEKGEEGE